VVVQVVIAIHMQDHYRKKTHVI